MMMGNGLAEKEKLKTVTTRSHRDEEDANSKWMKLLIDSPDYDEFLKQKLAISNGTQWEKEVEALRRKVCNCRTDGTYDVKLTRSPQKILERLASELLAPDDDEDGYSDDEVVDVDRAPLSKPKKDSDDEFEPEFSRGDRVEARFGGQASYYSGIIERVHPNGTCDISYDDGDEEERVNPSLIRALPKKTEPRKPKKTSDDGYESNLFESD
ncbi:hypothetical protein JG687_00005360 [Phytophthora cactorum]|uniref:Tudor domain-containing protein n=1 Tax=Phytophthora cactorum TaxID=29920 RepID=A0A8T1UNZ8_9STRA|nr:hypothetical protein JG687_00005360 [Phytophthora cactorum]